jgi:hypothetical protein
MGGMRNAYNVLVGKPEGKGPSGKPRCRFQDMEVGEIWGGGVDWVYLPQDKDQWRALVNAVMNLRVP